ncbi:MBL fold metallo-hydrolase [Algoriphagus namhaensis]|uniref:MBL fold metallo-hydrolase n=1 Tax=Algoriphagus namhaensis TaxID=915353 RepID=A0ABV8AV59_9BACT
MKVKFLGTGTSQGVPVITCQCEVCKSLDYRDKRFRASIHVEVDDKSLVVDTGPDFRMQMLNASVKNLDAIIYTHEHKDHTAGLDDIRPFNFVQKKDMPIYGRKQVLEQIKTEFAYVFSDKKYPGVPQIKAIEINDAPFEIGGTEIIPLPVWHYKLPVYGFRIKDFAYITDTNNIPEETLVLLKNLDVLVLNALQKAPHISHFTLEEAIEMAQKIGAKRTFFTHISHRLGMHDEVEQSLPDGIFLGYDGLEVVLN